MFRNRTILSGDSANSAEFRVVPGNVNDSTMFCYPPIPPRNLRNREFCGIPRDSVISMIVFQNIQCFLIFQSLPGASATANSAEIREVPGMPMIVFNNVLFFVILKSLSGGSAIANSAEFRWIPVISMKVFNSVLCFVILLDLPGLGLGLGLRLWLRLWLGLWLLLGLW